MSDGKPAYELLKKLSTAKFFRGGIVPPLEGVTQPLYVVVGQVSGMRTGVSDKGEWMSVIGSFGVQTHDGNQYRGGEYFPPGVVADLLRAQCLKMCGEPEVITTQTGAKQQIYRLNGDVTAFDIGYRVSVIGNEGSVTKYEFGVAPLFADRDDELGKALTMAAGGTGLLVGAPSAQDDAD